MISKAYNLFSTLKEIFSKQKLVDVENNFFKELNNIKGVAISINLNNKLIMHVLIQTLNEYNKYIASLNETNTQNSPKVRLIKSTKNNLKQVNFNYL